jgi:2-polyprenyl-3-methyl-5-hydroxy-6-metoxy-1,4-benzoquinol methylase
VRHLHRYDWQSLTRRYEGIAAGERLMADKHPWFEPFFRARVTAAADAPPAGGAWATAAALPLVGRWPVVGSLVRRRADRHHHQRLAQPFLEAWDAGRDLDELRAHLGGAYDHERLVHHVEEVEREEESAPDDATFYRTSTSYLYDLTVFAMSGTKYPYRQVIRRLVPRGARLLDYGCGIGADGLRLLEEGYDVSFADFANPSVDYLRWRLARRSLDAPIHDIEGDVPGGHDLAYCFDVVEHVDDPFEVLARLEALASIVVVNFLEPTPEDTHVHKPLDIPALLDHAAARGLRHYGVYHGRSHLVAYGTAPPDRLDRARSTAWRLVGARRGGGRVLTAVERAGWRARRGPA